ncbi:MAG: DUF63 family protein [Candidatus Anstonellales archaeon]
MALEDFFKKYFLDPINYHEGYNQINTLAYALLALFLIYLIYMGLQRFRIKVDREFSLAVLSFILFGSALRVVSDSVDTGTMKSYINASPTALISGVYSVILSLHLYDYRYVSGPLDIIIALHSPGIYFVVGGLFLITLLACRLCRKPQVAKYVGFVLFIWHFLLLAPMIKYYIYGVLALILALIASYVMFLKLRYSALFVDEFLAYLSIGAHALDGAATFVAMDLFNKFEPACLNFGRCYFEQHVVSKFIGEAFSFTGFGFFFYFLAKALLASAAVYFLSREIKNDEELRYILLFMILFGLAPGFRDILRMMTGS